MSGLAYLFERFPSFTQTFCYREIGELRRQKTVPAIFSVRHPHDEPPQAWDPAVVRDVEYLPDEKTLIAEVDRALHKEKLPAAARRAIAEWGRKTDFLRLYQAAWLGPRLQAREVRHVHAHFAGLAARTGYWLKQFFGIGYSFTAHANDIFAPKPFEVSLGKLIAEARAVVTVSDFGVRFLQEKFPQDATRIHRVYNGIDLSLFKPADFAAETPTIISVGRLIEKKGFQDLIEACRLLRESGIKFRCEIVGEGPLESELREQIATTGLTDIVRLAGPLPQDQVIEAPITKLGLCITMRHRNRWRDGSVADGCDGSDGRWIASCLNPDQRSSGNGCRRANRDARCRAPATYPGPSAGTFAERSRAGAIVRPGRPPARLRSLRDRDQCSQVASPFPGFHRSLRAVAGALLQLRSRLAIPSCSIRGSGPSSLDETISRLAAGWVLPAPVRIGLD